MSRLDELRTSRSRRPEDRVRFSLPVRLPLLLCILTGIIVTTLSLRFGMRAVGVREDIPLPGLVYSLTAPLVEPFYRFFPVSNRFDYPVVEVASLAAAAAVIALALVVYLIYLFLFERLSEDTAGK